MFALTVCGSVIVRSVAAYASNRCAAFRRRIDRAGDAALGGLPRRPQGDDQIVQQHHRPAGRCADDVVAIVDLPALARPGQDDVPLLGIDEHVLDALQAAEEFDFVGQGLAVFDARFGDGLDAAEGDFAQSGRLVQLRGDLRQSLRPRRAALPWTSTAALLSRPSASMEMPPTGGCG